MIKKYLQNENYYKITIILGIFLSIIWIAVVNTKLESDFKYYYEIATDIANGLTWGDTYTSIGYSIVLGGIFKLFGASLLKAKIFNIVLTFICYVCFMNILKKLDINEKDRRIIFALFVFFPNNIFYNSILATEILFTAILLIITLIYFTKCRYKYILMGILCGLNTMIKPFFLVFFFAVFLIEFIINKKFFGALKNSLIILIMTSLVIAPWVYRNTKMMGEFTFVSNNGGIVLYINNNSDNKFGRWMPVENVKNSIVNTKEYKEANATEKDKMLAKAAKSWIKTHPIRFIVLGFERLLNNYFLGDDILYVTYGTGMKIYVIVILFILTNIIRNIIFIPAVIYILKKSFSILNHIIKRKNYELDKFELYNVVLFFMFSTIYFLTEGQGRYAFPEIFIMVYSFYYFRKERKIVKRIKTMQ
ncbi:membrane protein [Clostridium scatologenes]|uniref:Glycosyltransferase RgtA/B/C/D-like domain-containing protein n=1 Tax=Clostridium scatologenes TaxID=1548 RepID=A0A0E3GSN7_CLOSL|nr:membrane protein [Clostridium scatologenes]AKA72391.1 hypothetical protein CSCA_5266 [Clostridium scatologenes]